MVTWFARTWLLLTVLACLLPLAGCGRDQSDELFRQGAIPTLRVRLLPEQEQQLRSNRANTWTAR